MSRNVRYTHSFRVETHLHQCMSFSIWSLRCITNKIAYVGTKCFCLTFTPGIEEHVNVFVRVMCGSFARLQTLRCDGQLVLSDDSSGGGVDGQLDSVDVLLHDLGLPAFILEFFHQRYDDVRALRHQRERAWMMTWTWNTCFEKNMINLVLSLEISGKLLHEGGFQSNPSNPTMLKYWFSHTKSRSAKSS